LEEDCAFTVFFTIFFSKRFKLHVKGSSTADAAYDDDNNNGSRLISDDIMRLALLILRFCTLSGELSQLTNTQKSKLSYEIITSYSL
jgi:hypothetical protein